MKKLIALLLLVPVLASADPGTATRWLMNEPASLLDIGIQRAENWFWHYNKIRPHEFDSGALQGSHVDTSVEYDYSNDMVRFRMSLRESVNVKEGCKELFRHDGVTITNHIRIWFRHAGYSRKDEPKDLVDNLRSRVELTCTDGVLVGRKMLMADDMYWTGE